MATRKQDLVRGEADGESAGRSNGSRVTGSRVTGDGVVAGVVGSSSVSAGAVSAVGAMSFEEAIARLGEIVDSLEEGEQPLEESIALFEEGMTLAKSSQEILDRAERRIEELLGVDGQGKPVVREIEPD